MEELQCLVSASMDGTIRGADIRALLRLAERERKKVVRAELQRAEQKKRMEKKMKEGANRKRSTINFSTAVRRGGGYWTNVDSLKTLLRSRLHPVLSKGKDTSQSPRY